MHPGGQPPSCEGCCRDARSPGPRPARGWESDAPPQPFSRHRGRDRDNYRQIPRRRQGRRPRQTLRGQGETQREREEKGKEKENDSKRHRKRKRETERDTKTETAKREREDDKYQDKATEKEREYSALHTLIVRAFHTNPHPAWPAPGCQA